MNRFVLFILVFAALISSCSYPGRGGGIDGKDKAGSPEQALEWLSETDRRAYDSWAQSTEKACDTAAIFSGDQKETALIDLDVYFKTHNALVIDSDGRFALIGGAVAAPGVHESSVGNASGEYTLEAQAKRDGMICTVTVYGQKVFESALAQHIQVVATYDPKEKARPALGISSLGPNVVEGIGTLSGHAFDRAIEFALEPHQELVKAMEGAIGISVDKFVRVHRGHLPRRSFSLPAFPNVHPFSEGDRRLIGPRSDLEAIAATNQSLAVVAHIAVPDVSFSQHGNHQDAGVRKFNATVALSAGTENRTNFTAVSLVPEQKENYDESMATNCFLKRFRDMKQLDVPPTPELTLTPAYAGTAAPCETFASDFPGALWKSNQGRHVLGEVLSGINPTDRPNYNGWDSLLHEFSRRAFVANGNLRAFVDPDNSAPVIGAVSESLQFLRSQYSSAPQLVPLDQTLVAMVTEWGLRTNPSADRRSYILHALKNSAEVFPESTEKLAKDLASDPEGSNDALAFAANLNDDYKNAAKSARESANQLAMPDLLEDRFGQVLQIRPPLAEIQAWSNALHYSAGFNRRELQRAGGAYQASERSQVADIIKKAMTESWSGAELHGLETIADVARHQPMCKKDRTASGAAECVGLQHFTREKGKFFDITREGRYGKLARVFANFLNQLSSDDGLLRSSLARDFFTPLWATCSNAAFDDRMTSVETAMRAYLNSSGLEKEEAARQIRIFLGSC